jgi:hypothetical protein
MGRKHLWAALAIAALLGMGMYGPPAAAYIGLCCGKCGGNMPMNIPGGGVPETYEFRVKLSPSFMRMDGLGDGTREIAPDSLLGMPVMGGRPTGKFMAVPTAMDMSMVNLSVGYSFSRRFFGGAMLMWARDSMDMRFNAAMRAKTRVDGFTMHSQGLGDTMLMGKYLLYADDPLIPRREVSLFAGLSLPSGSISERNDDHPVAARRRELLPYGMQLGSGTVDPTLGVLYQGRRSPYWWGADGRYTARLYDNHRGYRLGDEFHYDLYGMYQFRYDLVGELQLNGVWQGRIRGQMDAAASGTSGHVVQGNPSSPFSTPLWDPRHYGGHRLFLTAGIQWQPAPFWIVDLQGGVPLYQDLNGPQLQQDYRVMLTVYVEIPTRRSIRYFRNAGGSLGVLGF